MKWHKEITSHEDRIYDYSCLFYLKPSHGDRQLALWKQENIRIALQDSQFSLSDIRDAVTERCSYCFKYDMYCEICPKFTTKSCCILPSYSRMKNAKTKKYFAKWHEVWCKEIKLWLNSWS